jgi:hypothetical protein
MCGLIPLFDSGILIGLLEGLAVHHQVRWVSPRSQLGVTLAAALDRALALGFDAAISALLGGGIAMASARGLRLASLAAIGTGRC